MAKKYLITYYDNIEAIEQLGDAERGRLFLALLKYGSGVNQNPNLIGNEKYLFRLLKVQIDRDNEKYRNKCDKNRQNIEKRWGEGSDNDTNVYERIRTYTKNTKTNTNTNTNKESIANAIPKKVTPKNDLKALIRENFSDEGLITALDEFVKMRKAIKAPLTCFALERIISKLKSLSADKAEQIAILEKSIVNSWKGIYALNCDFKRGSSPKLEPKETAYDIDEYEKHSIFDDEEWEKKWTNQKN